MGEWHVTLAPVSEPGTRWLGAAAALALVALVLRQPLLLVLAVVLALVTALARLWWRHGLSAITYRRRFSATRAFFGEEIVCELITENAKPLPLTWLEVVDEFPADLEVVGATLEPSSKVGVKLLRAFFSVGPYERVRRRYRIRCRPRGYYRFGPATLTTGDLFGFAAREREGAAGDDLIVYPRVVPVATFGLPARRFLGDARPVRPLVEDPFQFAGVRPCGPGDSSRRIHWHASARTGTLQVRRYDPGADPVVALFLDTNTFASFWEAQDGALVELAISVAASLAAHALAEGRQVGLCANAAVKATATLLRIAPGRHPAQLGRILEALARLLPGSGLRIEHLVLRQAGQLPWGATIVVVTARVTGGLRRALGDLARGGRRPVLVVCGAEPALDPALRRRLVVYHVHGEEAGDACTALALGE